jgi:DNA-directed RNA polymerase subunit H
MVPKHEIMTKKEKEVLLKRLNVGHNGLPKILSDDPAIKDLGASPGDVVKITRASQTAGHVFYYRTVI